MSIDSLVCKLSAAVLSIAIFANPAYAAETRKKTTGCVTVNGDNATVYNGNINIYNPGTEKASEEDLKTAQEYIGKIVVAELQGDYISMSSFSKKALDKIKSGEISADSEELRVLNTVYSTSMQEIKKNLKIEREFNFPTAQMYIDEALRTEERARDYVLISRMTLEALSLINAGKLKAGEEQIKTLEHFYKASQELE